MRAPGPSTELVGRERLLDRLDAVVERARTGHRAAALLGGEAGIGKTSMLRAAAALAAERGMAVAWGTGIDLAAAPGFWPWTQAIDELVRSIGVGAARQLAGDDVALVASIAPALGAAAAGELSERDRLLAIDATNRFLVRVAATQPLLLVLDDLHWADDSSLALLEFVAGAPQPASLAILGAYRHDELVPSAKARLDGLATRAEHLRVVGLDAEAVAVLVARVAGSEVAPDVVNAIHRRTGGHPFFVRELALLGDAGTVDQMPGAVRDAIAGRIARLPAEVVELLEAAAVGGVVLRPDVVAGALDRSVVAVEAGARAALDAGLFTTTAEGTRFAHDLLREAVLDRLEGARRAAMHQAVGAALEARTERGGDVAPAELARHFVAAIPVDGTGRAVRWALAAAAADVAGLAFGEAAGHLRRLRGAAADAGVAIPDGELVEVLLAEADALSRAGGRVEARGLLRHAADVAARLDEPPAVARVALAAAQLGARFATRRDEAVEDLEAALAAVAGADDRWEARLAATLARELQHSVPEDRPRAGPLSERALELGRRSQDPEALLDCLLARHDVLWTPGTGAERAEVAREIVAAARVAGDAERLAQGLLLLANARLELGSAAWSAALDDCLDLLATLGGPRHRYTALTRQACRALLRGDLAAGEALVEEAADLGDRILEPDTGNVRMSQRLELVRARGDTAELQAFAAAAVEHWVGAPVHAHAVAAGFHARAGALDEARAQVAAVVELGTWRADRSYLWSVFVRELARAAVALDDVDLCRQLLEDVEPLVPACGVNGAAVAFAGSLAHTAGILADHLGRPGADGLLDEASATYERLGAAGWAAELRRDARRAEHAQPGASMRRQGPVWRVAFAGREATVPHSKGLADLARLVAAAGAEVHALDLVGSDDRSGGAGPMVDGAALAAYRRRLQDLDEAIDEAVADNDPERRARAEAEREAVVEELGRVLGHGGRTRTFANRPAERARKAVSARIRDAIRKLEPQLPELATHLEQSVVTGGWCRYRPGAERWEVDLGEDV